MVRELVLPALCGLFHAHLVCRSLSVGFWICPKGNLSLQCCSVGVPMGRRRVQGFLFLLLIDTTTLEHNSFSHFSASAHIVPSFGQEILSSVSANYLNILQDSALTSPTALPTVKFMCPSFAFWQHLCLSSTCTYNTLFYHWTSTLFLFPQILTFELEHNGTTGKKELENLPFKYILFLCKKQQPGRPQN